LYPKAYWGEIYGAAPPKYQQYPRPDEQGLEGDIKDTLKHAR